MTFHHFGINFTCFKYFDENDDKKRHELRILFSEKEKNLRKDRKNLPSKLPGRFLSSAEAQDFNVWRIEERDERLSIHIFYALSYGNHVLGIQLFSRIHGIQDQLSTKRGRYRDGLLQLVR